MREIPVTEDMKAHITRVNKGAPVDFDSIAVFEARSLNTRPLRRSGGLFQKAVNNPSVLQDMEAKLNSSDEGIPLHVMHNTESLNIGKLFRAKLSQANDGAYELSSQFYVPRQHADVVAKLNTGVTDQVSVGILAKELKCSKCDFDYRKGGIENLLMGQCKKKHVIGKDGTHVELHGLEKWGEMSLVDSGAAEDARVTHAAASMFSTNDNHNELGTSIPLIANLSELSGEENIKLDEAQMKALLEATLSSHESAHTEAVAALQAKLTAAEAQVTTLTAERDTAVASAATVPTLTAERDTARTERDATAANFAEAETFLKEQATKAQVAAGVKTPVQVGTFKEAITKITESGVNLVNLFARDQHVKSIDENADRSAAELTASIRGFRPYKETK